jgi:hypothetical protein
MIGALTVVSIARCRIVITRYISMTYIYIESDRIREKCAIKLELSEVLRAHNCQKCGDVVNVCGSRQCCNILGSQCVLGHPLIGQFVPNDIGSSYAR